MTATKHLTKSDLHFAVDRRSDAALAEESHGDASASETCASMLRHLADRVESTGDLTPLRASKVQALRDAARLVEGLDRDGRLA